MHTPNNILIHLKVYDAFHNKLTNRHIIVNEQLGISGESYNLHGIIYHIGHSMNSGHYFAEIQINGIWYRADDTSIRQIGTPSDFSYSKTPYILLYRKGGHDIDFTMPDIQNTVTSKMQEQVFKEIEFQKKTNLIWKTNQTNPPSQQIQMTIKMI